MKKTLLAVPVFTQALIAFTVQASEPSVSAKTTLLEEVIVTARRHEEQPLDIPISLLLFIGEQLERAGISNLQQLDSFSPNVTMAGSGGLGSSNAAFYIRGIGTSRNAINQEPAVALYIDDAYYGRSDGALLELMDVERVEVLRGPQGTLFGRNATAGAIRYITRPIADSNEGEAVLTLGRDRRRDIKGLANWAINEDSALRASLTSRRQTGYITNPDTDQEFGDQNTLAGRLAFAQQLSPSLTSTLTLERSRIRTQGAPSLLISVNPDAPFINQEANAGFDARTLPAPALNRSYQTGANFLHSDSEGAGLSLTWQQAPFTGKYRGHFRALDIQGAYDTDATHASLFEQNYHRKLRMQSHEVTLERERAQSRWLAGLYHYRESASDIREVGFTANSARDRTNTRIVDPAKVVSTAAFIHGRYTVSPTWAASAGLRYTRDTKHIAANELNANNDALVATVVREQNWQEPTWQLGLEWQASKQHLWYGQYARGFRAGGFNDRIRADLAEDYYGITAFDAETLDNIELGFKSRIIPNRWHASGAIFMSDYQDMQLGSILPGTARTVIQNAGEARLSGLELSNQWLLGDGWYCDSHVGFLSTQYRELAPSVTAVTRQSDFPRAPKWSYSLGLGRQWQAWHAYIAYGWKDRYRTVVADNDALEQAPVGIVNMSITHDYSKHWQWRAFITNATDQHYWLSGLNLDAGKPMGVMQGEPARPREFGITLKYVMGDGH